MKRIQQTSNGRAPNREQTAVEKDKRSRSKSPNYNKSQKYSDDEEENAPEIVLPVIDSMEKIMTGQGTSSSPYSNNILFKKNPSGFALNMNKRPEDAVIVPKQLIENNYDLFKSLLSNPVPFAGLIYSDENFKIECKVKYLDGPSQLGIMLVFISTSKHDKIEDISLQLNNYNNRDILNIQISKPRYPDGSGIDNPQILLKCHLIDSFARPPSLTISGRIGMIKIEVDFALPILVTKFLQHYVLPIENFSTLWLEASDSPKDSPYQKLDAIFPNPMAETSTIMDFLKKICSLLNNLHFKIYPPSNRENFHEIEGISILKCDSLAIPIMVQISFVPSHPQEFRFSLRSKDQSGKFSSLLLDIYSVIKFYINY